MRGPHNLWRLIRTGATFERTGAMAEVLDLMEAPAALRVAARVLGWPFQWLGHAGDPAQPPVVGSSSPTPLRLAPVLLASSYDCSCSLPPSTPSIPSWRMKNPAVTGL